MADVELVIKIDEGIAKGIIDWENDTPRHIVRGFQSTIADAIKNGTPLPKGHGKIVDVSEMVKTYAFEKKTNALCGDDDAFIEAIKHVSTIIEADKESEE